MNLFETKWWKNVDHDIPEGWKPKWLQMLMVINIYSMKTEIDSKLLTITIKNKNLKLYLHDTIWKEHLSTRDSSNNENYFYTIYKQWRKTSDTF